MRQGGCGHGGWGGKGMIFEGGGGGGEEKNNGGDEGGEEKIREKGRGGGGGGGGLSVITGASKKLLCIGPQETVIQDGAHSIKHWQSFSASTDLKSYRLISFTVTSPQFIKYAFHLDF